MNTPDRSSDSNMPPKKSANAFKSDLPRSCNDVEQRNTEKHREMQRNTEKCREIQRSEKELR